MSEFLVIDIKTFDEGGFQFCQTVLIRKLLESTEVEHFNGFPKPTKVEAPFGKEYNGSEANIDWTKSYASIIGMMLYLASTTRPYISVTVH